MQVKLAYGKTGLNLDLVDDWDVEVIQPLISQPLGDPKGSLIEALRNPITGGSLRSSVISDKPIAIILNDITRATPSKLLLESILEELGFIPDSQIKLFIALGTHRRNTKEELTQMIGEIYVDRFEIIQNDAFDKSSQLYIGETHRGHPVWLNNELVRCGLKMLTGFIEPHFFAGYSGGGKAVMPGMAGLRTIMANHGADMIADPGSTWGITAGNPIWEEIQEITGMIEHTFLLNVALDQDQSLTAIFCGSPSEAVKTGCDFVGRHALIPVKGLFDIVVTSNAGYPLDLNLYQTIKGISAASRIVRQNGAIIVAAQCWDGVPEHGSYGKLVAGAGSPVELFEKIITPGFQIQDQWQAQIQAQIQMKAQVYLYTDGLTDDQIRMAMLKPSKKIEDTMAVLMDEYGCGARIAVMPYGPLTVPVAHKI